MNVYVLCGGKGTRLGGHNKCMTPVHGRPFMDYKIDQLRRCGATDITLITGPFFSDYAHYDAAIISDEQTGVADALQYVQSDSWWTMGDVLLEYRLFKPSQNLMVVTRAKTPNIAGLYHDCGLYYGKSSFYLRETPLVPLTINTPEDLEETVAALV